VTTSCTPTAGQGCLTLSGETLGTDAADFEYQSYGTGGGAVCFAYVYENPTGWHPLDVLCTQDLAPPTETRWRSRFRAGAAPPCTPHRATPRASSPA
jgi:hypothetical protein